MEKQFCTYEISRKLKELGFNEKCLYSYSITDIDSNGNYFENPVLQPYEDEYYIKAPLWQQAIDWFREVHDIHIEIEFYTSEGEIDCSYVGWIVRDDFDIEEPIYLDSYYLARESAIKEAIELIENK